MAKPNPVSVAFALLCLAAVPAHAVPGGELGTIETGKWFCEKPGDAATPAVPNAAESFTAVPDSSYIAANGSAGSYLLLGDELVMTSGALKGHRYHLDSEATMHLLDREGDEIELRCVRAGDPAANHVSMPDAPGGVAPANSKSR